ncbi:hypothetical protein ACH5RR_015525 [Cinchona calisaya]|uniref:Uncharacterized protein n=1 Tax=Cinchona calisaya TaxID=153742 RepID=A0ABD2ZTD0_9GENT
MRMMLEKLAGKLDSLDLKSSTKSRDACFVCLNPMHTTQDCPSQVGYPDCPAEQANGLNFNGKPLGCQFSETCQFSSHFKETQVGQLDTQLSNREKGQFSSHPDVNPKGHIQSIITLRNEVMQIAFGSMKAELNIFDISRQPPDIDNINGVNLIDSLTHSTLLQPHYDDSLESLFVTPWLSC